MGNNLHRSKTKPICLNKAVIEKVIISLYNVLKTPKKSKRWTNLSVEVIGLLCCSSEVYEHHLRLQPSCYTG